MRIMLWNTIGGRFNSKLYVCVCVCYIVTSFMEKMNFLKEKNYLLLILRINFKNAILEVCII